MHLPYSNLKVAALQASPQIVLALTNFINFDAQHLHAHLAWPRHGFGSLGH